MKILRGGGSENFWTPKRGALKKLGGGGPPQICILVYRRGRAPRKLNC